MPRRRNTPVLTWAPGKSAEAIDEVNTGIDAFIEWANRARTGETAEPAAVQANTALTEFSEGRFDGAFSGFNAFAIVAGANIRHHVRDGHWHLNICPRCNRWLLAKDQRRLLCRRDACVKAAARDRADASRKHERRRQRRARDAVRSK